MPPEGSGFVLGTSDREIVGQWLDADFPKMARKSAPDVDVRQPGNNRMIRAHGIVRFLAGKFQLSSEDLSTPGAACVRFSRDELLNSGALLAEYEKRIALEANPAFIGWFDLCIEKMLKTKQRLTTRSLRKGESRRHVSWYEDFLQEGESLSTARGFRELTLKSWDQLSGKEQRRMATELTKVMIGPPRIQQAMGFTGPLSEINGSPKNEVELVSIFLTNADIAGSDSVHASIVKLAKLMMQPSLVLRY